MVTASEGLRAALTIAFRRARLTGCTMNVSRTGAGIYFASEFRPVLEQRTNWLRVRADGRVEDGKTKKYLGLVTEVGAGS